MPRAHHQLGPTLGVVLEMCGNLRGDHVALALANYRHVDRAGLYAPAEDLGIAHEIRDSRAGNLVLARHASDVGARAADPSALHDRRSSPRCRQMPGDELATGSTAEDESIVSVNHGDVPSFWANAVRMLLRAAKSTLSRPLP